jgi:hypothetical protein
MAITYPLTPPSTAQWGKATWMPWDAVSVQGRAFTGLTTAFDWDGSAWMFELQQSLLDAGDATHQAWRAFYRKLRNGYGTFLFGDPSRKTPLGVGTGTPLVNGAGQSGNSLITDGWTNSITNILRNADYFQLENNLYMNLNDVNSGASTGPATLDIWPSLRKVPADNAPITVLNPVGYFRILGQANFDLNPDFFMTGQPFIIIDVPQLG